MKMKTLNIVLQIESTSNYGIFISLIFPITLVIFGIWKGKTKPIVSTILFLSYGILLLYFFKNILDKDANSIYKSTIEDSEAKRLGPLLIATFLALGCYYFYRTVEKNSNKSKITATSENTTDNLQIDIYTQINNLNELKEKGILTDEEFQVKKQKLLTKI